MDTFTRISVQQAHELIGSSDVTIVDVRDPIVYSQGHIAQARIVNDENINEFLKETNKELPLICYCYHGISSQRAALFFAHQGFKKVYSVDGGWEEWKATYG